MNKSEFIDAIKPALKNDGYRKKGSYWYKHKEQIILCINVQGSQWDTNDYYVEIGIAMFEDVCYLFPTLMLWRIRHRCVGRSGELNIEPDELFREIKKHHTVCEKSDLPQYLSLRNAKRVVNQFWF